MKRVNLFLASAGNHFMVEIAQIFKEGFEANGLTAKLIFDEPPLSNPSEDLLQIVVAPHEFYVLFLEKTFTPREVRDLTSGVYFLNVEQPGSSWFEIVYRFAKYSLGVLDINVQGVNEFLRRGIFSYHFPIGYSDYLEIGTDQQEFKKTADILVLASHSPRRELFVAKNADFFNRYNCQFIFVRPDYPRLLETPGYYAEEARNQLLRSAKILINIHSEADRNYFEWHRVLSGIANHCLVISEESTHTEPLVHEKHLIFSSLEEIPGYCQYYLEQAQEREKIVADSYFYIKEEFNSQAICSLLLKNIEQNSRSRLPWMRSTKLTAKKLWYQGSKTKNYLKRLPGRSQRFLKRKYYQLKEKRQQSQITYLNQALKNSLLESMEFRANRDLKIERTLRRLELVQLCDLLGKDPYVLEKNSTYGDNPQPSISVIITLYNYSQYIETCLDSVCKTDPGQLSNGFEIIVVDDCSTDESIAVVRRYMERSAFPICLVRKLFNTGLSDSRNVGLKLANSPYVFILDADNWIYPNCLPILYQTIVNSDYVAVYGMLRKFNSQGESVGLESFYEWEVRELIKKPYIDAMALFNKAAILQLGGYSTALTQYWGWEDYDLWLRFAQANYQCKRVPQVLCNYRVHSASMVNITNTYSLEIAKYFRKKFYDLVDRNSDLETFFCHWRDSILP